MDILSPKGDLKMQSSQPETHVSQMKSMFNLFTVLCEVMAFPVHIFSVRWGTWGSRHLFNLTTALGFFWPWIFASLYGPHPHLFTVLWFWLASIMVLILHRVRGLQLRRQGYRIHSKYWGDCWTQRDGSLAEQRRARERMAMIALMIGGGCFLIAKPLGAMIALSAIAKLISDALTFGAAEARLREMEDARIENDFYLGNYRMRNEMD
jgi:hypothetical protein